MKVEVKQESELSNFEPLPPGEYGFTVLQSDEIESKSAKNKGKLMFAVNLNVHGPKGDTRVKDFFSDWLSPWKLRHFAATTGQLAQYESGNFDGRANAFEGRQGWVKLVIEPANGKFEAKNSVKDYIVKEGAQQPPATAAKPQAEGESPFNDDPSIPF